MRQTTATNGNQTHVWVRTDMAEAVLNNNGTLPDNWKPSRKRGRSSNKLAWGWARAYIVPQTTPQVSGKNGISAPESPSSNPFLATVKLRKVKGSPLSNGLWGSPPRRGPAFSQNVPVTVTIQDDEFAPPHLQNKTVTIDPNHESAPLHMANSWWYSGETNYQPPDDLTSLTHLHEPAVVLCLKRRYEHDHIYTYTGKILLALNPFRACKDLYGDSIMQDYYDLTGNRPPPHIYGIAQDAYGSMLRAMQMSNGSENQSILVSGESGAGKTVTTKIIMQYLATLSRRHVGSGRTESGDIESQGMEWRD